MLSEATLKVIAERELSGVGDALLGEWRQMPSTVYHLRRRLTAKEAETVGPVIDIRSNRAEVERRLRPVRRFVGEKWTE
jgi:hypothetical protein